MLDVAHALLKFSENNHTDLTNFLRQLPSRLPPPPPPPPPEAEPEPEPELS